MAPTDHRRPPQPRERADKWPCGLCDCASPQGKFMLTNCFSYTLSTGATNPRQRSQKSDSASDCIAGLCRPANSPHFRAAWPKNFAKSNCGEKKALFWKQPHCPARQTFGQKSQTGPNRGPVRIGVGTPNHPARYRRFCRNSARPPGPSPPAMPPGTPLRHWVAF